MLKGIPGVISPDMLKTLAEMGHGDTITIGDAYFAAASLSKDHILLRADGIDVCTLLDAILTLMPLDHWCDSSVTFMGQEQDGKLVGCEMTDRMHDTIAKYDKEAADGAVFVDRFGFYDLTRRSYAVVASGETENYGCVILQKGVK